MTVKYKVEAHELRKGRSRKRQVIRESSVFDSQQKVDKWINNWDHQYNVLQGRYVEFRTYNSRWNPEKFR